MNARADILRETADPIDANAWADAMRDRAERALERILPAADVTPRRLHEAMRYATLGGGKRVRALLVYAGGHWADGSGEGDALDRAAAAVELIHAYSLAHDDLPCMDDDDLRRGRPSLHVAFDEATALLAGDALQALAFEALVPDDAPRVAERVRLLATASGSIGMAGGQAIDLDSVGKRLDWPTLETMHRAKTGALLRAAILLGPLSVRAIDARERDALEGFAAAIGLAFQVVDDVLDVETDSATLGKTAGKDAAHDKPTVVSTLGLVEAKALAACLRDDAYESLGRLGGDTDRLRAIADFIVARRS